MTPETTMHLLNYAIIVLIVTILYCIGLIIFRAVRITRGINKREREFMNSVYFKLKTREWEQLNGKVPNHIQLEKGDDHKHL